VAIPGGADVLVDNLSLDAPATTDGGLASTLAVPLPDGGLISGGTVNIAVTFAVDQGGTYWFGYDVDALGAT
jgi:hypothetical protein